MREVGGTVMTGEIQVMQGRLRLQREVGIGMGWDEGFEGMRDGV